MSGQPHDALFRETFSHIGTARSALKAIEEGLERGRAEGKRQLLVKLLSLNFGKLSADAKWRLDSATLEHRPV